MIQIEDPHGNLRVLSMPHVRFIHTEGHTVIVCGSESVPIHMLVHAVALELTGQDVAVEQIVAESLLSPEDQV